METIELAVERMRRAKPVGTAPRVAPPVPDIPQPSSPQSRLPIKTRVLCDYSEDVQAIISGPAPAKPVRSHTLEVAIASAFGGAALVFAAFWLVQPPGRVKAETAAVAAAAPLVGSPAAAPAPPPTPRPEVPAAATITAERPAEVLVSAPAAAVSAARASVAAGQEQQVRELVAAWAQAWSARDVERYLGYYASGFKPERALTRSAWENQRRQRLAGARSIRVGVHDLRVEVESTDRAVARFAQDYAADAYREAATPKRLLLVREAGAWRIAAEAADAPGKVSG